MKKTDNELIIVRRSRIHGRGVFAIAPIRKGKRIIEYAGKRVTWKEAQEAPPHRPDEPHHTFLFSLDDKWVIDAGQGGNSARWINHSCEPNCETGEAKKRIYVYALRDIYPGEELYYDYQIEPAERRTKALAKDFACHCGTAKCRGTMLEPVKKKRRKRKNVSRRALR